MGPGDRIETIKELEEIGPWAWPGGYTNIFQDRDGSTLCFLCAKADIKAEEEITYLGYVEGEEQNDACDACGLSLDTANDVRTKGGIL